MQISQIFISDHDSKELPIYIQQAVETVKTKMLYSEHKIYLNEELKEWILLNYGLEMLKAYEKIIPYAYKADLARYLLLYKIGGWYFDITIRVINGVSVGDDIDFVTFFDFPQYSNVSYACNNAIIYAKKKSIILEDLINKVYFNVKNEYYGKNPLYITGPIQLGKSVAKFESDLSIISGSFMDLTPGFQNRNRGFVFNDGLLFALHKHGNKGGDLKSLGIEGTNNYAALYNERKAFRSDIILSDYKLQNDFNPMS